MITIVSRSLNWSIGSSTLSVWRPDQAGRRVRRSAEHTGQGEIVRRESTVLRRMTRRDWHSDPGAPSMRRASDSGVWFKQGEVRGSWREGASTVWLCGERRTADQPDPDRVRPGSWKSWLGWHENFPPPRPRGERRSARGFAGLTSRQRRPPRLLPQPPGRHGKWHPVGPDMSDTLAWAESATSQSRRDIGVWSPDRGGWADREQAIGIDLATLSASGTTAP